jgi:hypothetical protein
MPLLPVEDRLGVLLVLARGGSLPDHLLVVRVPVVPSMRLGEKIALAIVGCVIAGEIYVLFALMFLIGGKS